MHTWLNSTPHAQLLPVDTEVVTITVNRTNILSDMINIFINQDIVSTELKVRFAGEIGSDTSGVSRDAYTCFRREFLANNADGEDTRVPAVNTKWQKDEWMAIGRILLKGFVDYKYFPLMMSIPFVVGLIFGKDAVTTEILKEGFSKYLCVAEKTPSLSSRHCLFHIDRQAHLSHHSRLCKITRYMVNMCVLSRCLSKNRKNAHLIAIF